MGGREQVFPEGPGAHRRSPSLTDWAGLQKSSFPWHHLQEPPQDPLLLTFAFDSVLALGLHPRTGCCLQSRLSAPAPQFPLLHPCPSIPPLQAGAWGTSFVPY